MINKSNVLALKTTKVKHKCSPYIYKIVQHIAHIQMDKKLKTIKNHVTRSLLGAFYFTCVKILSRFHFLLESTR